MTEARRGSAGGRAADGPSLPLPAHLAVYLGVSAGAYAILLAGVTALQATSEATLAAERAPMVADLNDLSAGHDQLTDRLARAKAAYEAAAAGYTAAAGPLADLEAGLASLATTVSAIDGASKALPTSVKLPSVATTVRTTTSPATHTTTGASGTK